MNSERGFTLIELLVVVAILSVLSFMGLTAFSVYKKSASYAVAAQAYADARRAMEAGITDIDNPPGFVPVTEQAFKGSIQDGAAQTLLPGFQLPANVKFSVAYDPDCDAGCERATIKVLACAAEEYILWVQLGGQGEFLMQHIGGESC